MSDSTSPIPAVVIGGGISGLACAYRLQRAGIPLRLLDSNCEPGGMIATVEQDGFRFERGPQSFLLTAPMRQLIDDLGLTGELLYANPRAPRYILLHGKLVPAPHAPSSLLTTPLLDRGTKWRLLSEIARCTHPPADDESISAFVRRKFGSPFLDRLVGPFVSGIYAGDPEKLSLRAAFPQLHEFERTHGSVLRGAMKSRPPKGTPRAGLCSFRAGMGTLPHALRAKLGDSYQGNTKVVSLRRAATPGVFKIIATQDGVPEEITANAIILATPAYTAGEILGNISEQFPAILSRIAYAPVAVISAGYRTDQVGRSGDGFGFLVPRSESLRVLGTVWNSSLFPGCAPQGMSLFTSFAGGATDPAFIDRPDREIADSVCAEVAEILSIRGTAITRMVRRYERALPQYNLGHVATIASIHALAASVAGLFLAGNYLGGPAIGTCVEQACQTAASVAALFSRPITASTTAAQL